MIIGPHSDMAVNYPCFQTHYGNPKSFKSPKEKFHNPYGNIWIWHCSYVAKANPNWEMRESNGEYLRRALEDARRYGVHCLVLHCGSAVNRVPEKIIEDIERFFKEYSLDREKIAIELLAHKCTFNRNPDYLASKFNWCLDLAHSYAAGVEWEDLRKVIVRYPPLVCHCNFPGSEFGSGKDIHGWRHKWQLYSDRKMMYYRENDGIVKEYDATMMLLNDLKVPLIVEGSGFPGNSVDEIKFIERCLSDKECR